MNGTPHASELDGSVEIYNLQGYAMYLRSFNSHRTVIRGKLLVTHK
jgi:hypothetical protein